MGERVRTEVHEGLPVITVDDGGKPNTLMAGLADEIYAAVHAVNQNPDYTHCLIRGNDFGAGFGADIKQMLQQALGENGREEFRAQTTAVHRALYEIEDGKTIFTFLLDGKRPFALGGCNELMLACDRIVSVEHATIAFPELNLLLFPGYGGMKRVADRCGIMVAIEAVLGRFRKDDYYTASEAVERRMIDALVPEKVDPFEFALGFAQEVPGKKEPCGIAMNEDEAKAAATKLAKRAGGIGQPTPAAAMAAAHLLIKGYGLPTKEAIALEDAAFLEVAVIEGRYGMAEFLARTDMENLADKRAAKDITHVGVLGCGNMGAQIAAALLHAGYYVSALIPIDGTDDDSRATIERERQNAERVLLESCTRAKLDEAAVEELRAKFGIQEGRHNFAQLANMQVVIEAALEDLEAKGSLLADFGEYCAENQTNVVVVASNSSGYGPNKLAPAYASKGGAAEDVIGCHFFGPVNVLDSVEIIRGTDTKQAAVDIIHGIVLSLGKAPIPLVDKGEPGFLVNAIFKALVMKVLDLIERGVAPQAIEDAVGKLRGTDQQRSPMPVLQTVQYTCPGTLKVIVDLLNNVRDGETPNRRTLIHRIFAQQTGNPPDKDACLYDGDTLWAGIDEFVVSTLDMSPEDILDELYRAQYEKERELIDMGVVVEKAPGDAREFIRVALCHGLNTSRLQPGLSELGEQRGYDKAA